MSGGDPAGARPRTSLPRRLALAGVATLVSMVLLALTAELVLSLADLGPPAPARHGEGDGSWAWGELIHRPSEVPGLAYELVPGLAGVHNGVTLRINALGLRGPERPARKPPGVRRVAVLGDSTTFGWGVEYEDTYCARLERLLDTSGAGQRHEVLDLGVSGYTTRDEALVLRRKALPLEPDVVLVGYNLNDPEIEPRQPLQRFFATPRWWWRWRTTRWTAAWWLRRERARAGGYVEHLHAPGSARWQSVVDGFADMAAATAEVAVPVLVVVFPLGRVPADPADYRHAPTHARVVRAAQEAGLDVLDLTAAFAAHADEELLLPDSHPNPRGHAVAAEAIAAHLAADPGRWW